MTVPEKVCLYVILLPSFFLTPKSVQEFHIHMLPLQTDTEGVSYLWCPVTPFPGCRMLFGLTLQLDSMMNYREYTSFQCPHSYSLYTCIFKNLALTRGASLSAYADYINNFHRDVTVLS